jgi:hypothetical protein
VPALQQCVPEPEGPQTPLAHWSSALHVTPAAFWATQLPPPQ